MCKTLNYFKSNFKISLEKGMKDSKKISQIQSNNAANINLISLFIGEETRSPGYFV